MAEFEVIDKSVSDRAIAAFDGIKEAIEDMEVPVGNVPVEVYPDKIRKIAISKIIIENVPSQIGTLTYNGNVQSPTWDNYDSSQLTISGELSSINTGTFTAIFTPNERYIWSDGTTEPKSVTWSIERAVIQNIPIQSGTLTYNGNVQSPVWNNYNSSQLTLGGTTSSVNAGTFNATFTPSANHKWYDGTTDTKTVTWTINKAEGSLSIVPTSLILNPQNRSRIITVTRDGDGEVSAESSNESVATVYILGADNDVVVNDVWMTSGSATITVSVAEGTNHNAPANQTASVSAEFAPPKPPPFADSTWQQAADISDMIAANGWTDAEVKANIGWEVGNTKSIVGGGVNLTLRIIGFNHDNAVGGGKAGISLQLSPVCWGATTADRIGMESTNTNANGWHGSRMKVTTLPSYKLLLPADLQAVIKKVLKPTATSGTTATIVNSQDDLWLLSEREVFGTNTNSAAGEGEQYAYWTANTSATARIHKQPSGTNYVWWLRSPYAGYSNLFCVVDNSGNLTSNSASTDFAVSFGLCIGNPSPKPEVDPTFGNNTWEQISQASTWAELNGLTPAQITSEFGWNVGDTKPVPMGTFTGTLRIIGFNHDNAVGGGKAGISLELTSSYGTVAGDRRYMNSTNTNVGGWTSSYMRQTVMPQMKGYLPSDLQAVIKPVNKLTSQGNNVATIVTTSDDLWLLSEIEIFGILSNSFAGEGSRYAYYTANNTAAGRIKQQPSGTNYMWWTRSPRSGNTTSFCCVYSAGGDDYDVASLVYGVSFGLCV